MKQSKDWPEGYGRRVLEETDSTLTEAARIAPGLTGPEWILARRQTAARGRRGRPWREPEGNLAATLVLRPDEPPARAALRSFVASLALIEACDVLTGQPEVFALKWPNDVLASGGKLAGILLESSGGMVGGEARLGHLAIGVGVNLIAAPSPDEVETRGMRPVSLADATGVEVDPETFLESLAAAYARWEDRFTSEGFAPVRNAWLKRAARLGETVTVRQAKAWKRGIFEDVDSEGNLILQTRNGRVAIAAAEVFF